MTTPVKALNGERASSRAGGMIVADARGGGSSVTFGALTFAGMPYGGTIAALLARFALIAAAVGVVILESHPLMSGNGASGVVRAVNQPAMV